MIQIKALKLVKHVKKGMEAGVKFSKGDKETLTCEA